MSVPFNPAAIRLRVQEVLEGARLRARSVPVGVFAHGAFEGQPDMNKIVKALQKGTARHRFDVELGSLEDHPATSQGLTGNESLSVLGIRISIWSRLKLPSQQQERAELEAQLWSDLNTAVKALRLPDALLSTEAGVETGIVGGVLFGPDSASGPRASIIRRDWEAMIAQAEIRATATLSIAQEAA